MIFCLHRGGGGGGGGWRAAQDRDQIYRYVRKGFEVYILQQNGSHEDTSILVVKL